MPIPRIGGPGVLLDLASNSAWWSRAVQGAAGYPFNQVALSSGAAFVLPPGTFNLSLGTACYLQLRDAVTGQWALYSGAGFAGLVGSDGNNFRVINLSQIAQSTTITAPGSGYTSPPTVTSSSGGSTYQAIIGGAVSLATTVAGGGYNYPPLVVISAPPPGGIQATAIVSLASNPPAGLVAPIMVNAGAGYTTPPQVLLARDPRDIPGGSGAVVTSSLTGAGTMTGLLLVDPGIAIGATAPTLTFSGGGGSGAAATVTLGANVTTFANWAFTIQPV